MPRPAQGSITTPLRRSRRDGARWVADANTLSGKSAITHYETLESFDKAAFLRVKLGTGRTHQIRVHLLSIGYPVVGERVYIPRRLAKVNARFPRSMLHAQDIAFDLNGAHYEYHAPLPIDFQQALAYFRGFNHTP